LSRLKKIQYNASAVQTAAMEISGTDTYFHTLTSLWLLWLENRHQFVPDLQILWGKGVSGADGIEGGWEKLCQGKVNPDEGLVYQL
jgi:Protein of unknown function (DUF2855)